MLRDIQLNKPACRLIGNDLAVHLLKVLKSQPSLIFWQLCYA